MQKIKQGLVLVSTLGKCCHSRTFFYLKGINLLKNEYMYMNLSCHGRQIYNVKAVFYLEVNLLLNKCLFV